MRRLWRWQPARFIVVGVLNTAFSYAVYAALLWVGLNYALANLGAALLGILFSFRTQGRWVFRNQDNRRLLRFALAWVLIYLFNIGLIGLLVDSGIDAYRAGALALMPVVVASFLVQKFFVFGTGRALPISDTSPR